MKILLLGGRGKTSIRIASLLATAKVPFVLASRTVCSSCPYEQVHFDWLDQSSWASPFDEKTGSEEESWEPISTVYIVPPSFEMDNLAERVISFIRLAREKGAKRFVLLSASLFAQGAGPIGEIHEYLVNSAQSQAPSSLSQLGEGNQGDIEFAVLRPSWFMENFSEQEHVASILEQNAIYTATRKGKLPFVSADDIARVGFHALTDEEPHNTDHIILGPELLSYDDTANILTGVLGRRVEHVGITETELATHLTENTCWSPEFCAIVATLDARIENGEENRLNNVVQDLTGKEPIRFEDFARKETWRWGQTV